MQNVMSALPSKADSMGIAGSLMFVGRCGGTLNPFKIITHRINNLAPKFDGDGLRRPVEILGSTQGLGISGDQPRQRLYRLAARKDILRQRALVGT